jgi:hypothetical protein
MCGAWHYQNLLDLMSVAPAHFVPFVSDDIKTLFSSNESIANKNGVFPSGQMDEETHDVMTNE